MTGIEKYNSPAKVQRIGNDSVYGNGADGNTTVSGTLTLSRDMYYNNLTVPIGNIILTNGYKIFVKGTATIDGVIGIGTVTGASNGVSNGTITSPGANVATQTLAGSTTSAITYTAGGLGGGSNTGYALTLPSFLANKIENILNGVVIDPVGGVIVLSGGVAGTTGSAGATAAKYTNSDSWTGKAGGAGSNGGYSVNASTVNAPGGKGNTGNVGTATGATDGTGGAGGAGGAGGPVVAIFAKTITGFGTIMALGSIGTAGTLGSTGSGGTAGAGPTAYTSTTQRGTSGVDLNDGHQAPAIHHTHGGYHHHHGHCASSHHLHHGGCNPHYDHSFGAHDPGHHCCCFFGYHTSDHCGYGHNLGSVHYTGGAGGAGGAAAPAVTGGNGKRGGGGGGGAIFIITETTPSYLTYDVRAATTADVDGAAATNGYAYVILNN